MSDRVFGLGSISALTGDVAQWTMIVLTTLFRRALDREGGADAFAKMTTDLGTGRASRHTLHDSRGDDPDERP
jgi:hypothetical protein